MKSKIASIRISSYDAAQGTSLTDDEMCARYSTRLRALYPWTVIGTRSGLSSRVVALDVYGEQLDGETATMCDVLGRVWEQATIEHPYISEEAGR